MMGVLRWPVQGDGESGAGIVELHQGDWLEVARGLSAASIDFVYADPPFNTGRTRRSPPAGVRLDRATNGEFADDFGASEGFIEWLGPRVGAAIGLLRPSGLICLHVDWRTSHRVRVMLDELLGEDRFVNHVVWSYGLGGSSARRFARKHDDLLLYCLNPDVYWFEPPMVPATSRRMRGRMKKATDVLSIPSINNMAGERTGYPTQKPLALLELLVRACCPAGGMVLDPCCGSGTTLVAAVMNGRRAIGIDSSAAAVAVARGRLSGVGARPAGVDGAGA